MTALVLAEPMPSPYSDEEIRQLVQRLAEDLGHLLNALLARLIPVHMARRRVSGSSALTVPQAARRLGVSEVTVRRLIRAGSLPSVRVGRSRRVPERALAEWIAGRTEGGMHPKGRDPLAR